MKNLVCLLLVAFLAVTGASPTRAAEMPVASAAAADPIWCPLGVTPLSAVGGCSPSFATLGAVLTWLGGNDPDQSGVIWISRTYDSAAEGVSGFTLDGAHFAHLDNHSLTIQGGWNGLGTTSVNHADRSVFTADFLRIDNWQAGVAVNDVLVDGPAATGIHVTTTGNITLVNTDVQNSVGGPGNDHGAFLSNYTGRGSVIVRDSTFNHNLSEGLLVLSSGAILLNHVTANTNGGDGADLYNRSSTTARPVILLGTNTFNGNSEGLLVFSKGSILVHSLVANANVGDGGVYLDNTSAASPQPVSLLGTPHTFHDNIGQGLEVNSHGAITGQYLDAQRNSEWGAVLANSGLGGAGSVMVTGNNAFLDNGLTGLNAISNGDISIFMAGVANNASHGVWFITPGHANLYCAKVYSNGGYGVEASAVAGPLTLNEVAYDGHNVSGDYTYPGTAAITGGGCALATGMAGGAPMRLVSSYVPGTPYALNCARFGGTQLALPDGRVVTLNCPTLGRAVVRGIARPALPGPLPQGDAFVSALNLSVRQNGLQKPITDGLTTLSFVVPAKSQGKSFAILYWDGKSWLDLSQAGFTDGRMVFDGGSPGAGRGFSASINFTGLFVLVRLP